MFSIKKNNLIRSLVPFCLLLAGLLPGSNQVFAFEYTNRDLVLTFAQEGGNNEMAVDLGPVSRFYSAAPGSTFQINTYSQASLSAAFSSLDGLSWAAIGCVAGTNGTPSLPKNTTWTTRPRLDPALPSVPWNRRSSLALGQAVNKMDSVGANARSYGEAFGGAPDPISNSETTLILPAGDVLAPSSQIGSGTFNGSWEGPVNNVTPSDFVSAGRVARSDFYEALPTPPSGPATYLGYFEFRHDGTLHFTRATPRPGLTGLSPASGPAAGGTAVTLSGANFVNGATVQFGGVPSSSVVFLNAGSVTAQAPPHAAGSVDVTLANPDGQFSILTNAFTYSGSVPPPERPRILSSVFSGNQLIIRTAGGTNGTATVWTSTDITAPGGNWNPYQTNIVSGDGLSTNTIPVIPAEPGRFFRISIP